MNALLRFKQALFDGLRVLKPPSSTLQTAEPVANRELLTRTDAALATGAGLLAGLVYWLGSAPGILFGDGGELQFAAWTAGLPHPTGYPLYMILGWLWTHLLAGLGLATPARAMNLLSVLLAAWAVALTYLLAHSLIELSVTQVPRMAQRLAGLTAALTFAFTPTFWSQALVTEVYALHAAFVALILGLALRWQKALRQERLRAYPKSPLSAPVPGGLLAPRAGLGAFFGWVLNGQLRPFTRRGQPVPALMVLALVLGLSLTHHRTSVLLVPVLLVFIWWQDGRRLRRPRWLVSLVLLTLLPLLLYLYVPLRVPHTPYLRLELTPGQTVDLIDRTPAGLLNYVLGRTFAGQLQGWQAALAAAPGLVQRFAAELTPVGLSLALLGLLCLALAGCWRLLWLTGGSFLLFTGFNLFYTIGDIHVFYIPSYLIAACWIGVTVACVGGGVDQLGCRFARAKRGSTLAALTVALVPLLVLPGLLFLRHADQLDRSSYTRPERWWRELLAANLPLRTLLISNDRDEMMPLWYLQQVEGVRPDVLGLFPGLLLGEGWANVGQVAETALASGRPVYLVKPMPGLEVKLRLGSAMAVGLTPVEGLAATNTPLRAEDAVIGGLVRLTGYNVRPVAVEPGQQLLVDLYWQPLQQMAVNYSSFVHLRLPDGRRIAQSDHLPGGSFYPTSLWRPGELLLDQHRLQVPEDAPSGPYELVAGMYELVDQQARAVGEQVLTGKVGGKPPAEAQNGRVARPFYANLDGAVLLIGFDAAGKRLAAVNGTRFSSNRDGPAQAPYLAVTLIWQPLRPMATDYTVFVHLVDQTGHIVAQRDREPFAGRYPTSVWQQGEVLSDTYRLPLQNVPAGVYEIVIGLYEAATQTRLPAFDYLGQRLPDDRVRLAQIELR